MARSKVVREVKGGKSPTVVGTFPSKLLQDCGRCGRPVFMCRTDDGRHVPVEVLEQPVGNVAIQAQIGSDDLGAVVVSSPRTYYQFHLATCSRLFSLPPGAQKKVRK